MAEHECRLHRTGNIDRAVLRAMTQIQAIITKAVFLLDICSLRVATLKRSRPDKSDACGRIYSLLLFIPPMRLRKLTIQFYV